MTNLIEVRNLKKGFGKDNEVLKSVDLKIRKGDFISIVGPSGSGKSTLLHILGCLDSKDSGTYLLDGKNIEDYNDRERAVLRNEKFGFVMQQYGLIEDETVIDNIMVPLLFTRKMNVKADSNLEEKMKFLGIYHLKDRKVEKLSGGEKQRVAIARALINDPDIILADEPTGALDNKNTILLMDEFCKIRRMGKTIILITHDMEVAKYTETCYKLKNGRLWSLDIEKFQ